ncbi:MAG: hypothetical protein E7627_07240 [Ruminococcaceae bacterium]|nr:hypothetical protein [Oscillospiraceae bacterium]
MFNKLRHYLTGWRRLTVDSKNAAGAFDLMYKNEIRFSGEQMMADGRVTVMIREREYKRFTILAEETEIEYAASELLGLPVTLGFIRRRPMLLIGLILAVFWLIYSENLVWDIKITGNTKTPTDEIINHLSDLGFEVGTNFKKVNFNKLHATYVAEQQDIAWLSIYMNGTVAEVQVKELYEDTRPKHEGGIYANVVATEDGVVESVNVFEGQAAVKAGDFVRAGQVLISGVVENKDGSVRYEYAAGEVICKIARKATVKVQSEREVKRYTGQEITKKSVKIFKKSINLFIKGGIEYPTCDKIDMMEQLCPFGLVRLPVWINTTVYKEYETVVETVPPSTAADDALRQLSALIKEKTADGELISKSVTTEFDNGVYRIDCLLHMLCDIGTTAEFYAENIESQK